MTEQEISRILLVRSVEEEDPGLFSPETLLEALKVAGDAEDDYTLAAKRAGHLFSSLPPQIREIARTPSFPQRWLIILFTSVFLLGMAFNYLGPGGPIHIVYNPLVLLLFWNLAVFFFFLLRRLFAAKKIHTQRALPEGGYPAGPAQAAEQKTPPSAPARRSRPFSPLSWLFRRLWFSWHQRMAEKKQDAKDLASFLNITSRYGEHWWRVHQCRVTARALCIVHLLAIALVLGALSGVYLRGLFSEYNVVWKSTFIHDPQSIALMLNIIFGLPSRMLSGSFIDAQAIAGLKAAGGEPAARWIHIFAACIFLYVIPPRLFLASLESRRVREESRNIPIGLGDPYYTHNIALAREMRANRLQEEISGVIQREISALAGSIATYVRSSFYNRYVVPRLTEFRQSGGCIRDLEEGIARESEAFRDELAHFADSAQEDFNKAVSKGISRIVGKKLSSLDVMVEGALQVKPDAYKSVLDKAVTQDMTKAVGIAVTAATAATMGTISGGFGKALGIAVVSTLLHTTGPVGFVIGALAGLLLGGSASIMAQDRITDVVRNRSFPAFSTRLMLGESRLNQTIEAGRIQVFTLIKAEVEEELSPHISMITGQVLAKIAQAISVRPHG
ncbi:MAG: DUF2868 domain-containing protein [Nitrospiraceae bacterium]|nr:MAG: DUF2868 domain-containing protein [Nitrospiraceae bacterium]